MRVWGLEKRCKLPSGVWVGAEAEIDLAILALESYISKQQVSRLSFESAV